MRFLEIVRQARDQVRDAGRVSLRALRLEYGLDDEALAALIAELVEVHQVATRAGDVLVWCGKSGGEINRLAPSGSRVGDQDASTATANRLAYTPKHLAAKILTSRSALEGERKQVTVLFADVKGSMELAEQLGAEEWHKILERFFQILTDGVHRFAGTVNQYTGDGIMALFGAPIAHEDHAQRACYAALHLRDALRAFGQELRREQELDFSTRIGLNSGDVVVGKIGDDLRMDYTAQGHTVGLAERVQRLAEAGRPYVAEQTAALVRGYFKLEGLGEFKLKGVAAPVRVYALDGPGDLRSRLDLSRVRGFSKFVGRADEMTTLQAALERVLAGSGQVVGIVGEAGVGKSRLCHEFVEHCRGRGVGVAEARCLSHGRHVPLLVWMDVLRNANGILDTDPPALAREKIAGRLVLLDETLTEHLPLFFDFLGVPDPDRPPPQLDPEVRQRRLLEITKRGAQGRSRRAPRVNLVEDLHWIDPASQEFLAAMIDIVPETRTFLLVNFRPEFHADWMRRSYYQQISLRPLGPEAARELVRNLVGEDPTTARLADLLQARTVGNPFFTEEIVQSLVESGHLQGERGAYRLSSPIERIAVPRTVQAVLAARIDRLPDDAKHVLQAAAVIGTEFTETLLKRVADLPEPDVTDALATLQRAEFVHQAALYPEVEYKFKHPLTRDVAYDSQLSDRRRRLHATLARALEETGSERRDERAALLAHHWEAAGDPLAAAREHLRAARWLQANDRPNALGHWRKVRPLAQQIGDTVERDRLRLAACLGLLTFNVAIPIEEAASAFAEGRQLAQDRGDRVSLVRILFWYANRLFQVRAFAERAECIREAESIAGDIQDPVLQFTLRSQKAWGVMMDGDFKQALSLYDEALAGIGDRAKLLGDPLGRRDYFGTVARRALVLTAVGRLADADRELQRLAREARTLNDPILEAMAHLFAAHYAFHQSDAASAYRCARRIEEIAEQLPTYQGPARVCLGIAHRIAGRLNEAVSAVKQGMHEARESGVLPGPGTEVLADALCELRDYQGARARAEEMTEDWNPLGAILGRILLARIVLETEGARSRQRIEELLRDATSRVERSGARIYAPRLCEVRGKLARLLGDHAGAEHELREAHRLFTEMGAAGHAERLAKEIGG